MSILKRFNEDLQSARPVFEYVRPNWTYPLTGPLLMVIEWFQYGQLWYDYANRWADGEEISSIAGSALGDKVTDKAMTPPYNRISSLEGGYE